MKPRHTDEDIEAVNSEILARRAGRAAPAPAAQPSGGEQPPAAQRRAVDLTGLSKNEFRSGMRDLSNEETAEWVRAYRASYALLAHDPQGEAIITLREKRLAAALAADGKVLSPMSTEEKLSALRKAAAARGNGI
jgi:hypothetical protein